MTARGYEFYLRVFNSIYFLVSNGNRTEWSPIGPLQDPVTWYRINYTGTQMTQWDFQNKGILTSPARLSFVFKVPLRHLRPSVIYSVPCDRILQKAFSVCNHTSDNKIGRTRSGSPICLSRVWLQTELDDTKSYYQLIITITISEKKKNSQVTKCGHHPLHDRASKGYGSIHGRTSQTDLHHIKSL